MAPRRSELHAIIGVRFSGNRTYYLKRSRMMKNFPSVWSLMSIRFDPNWLDDRKDLIKVQKLMTKMSQERLGGVPIITKKYLTSGDDPNSPVGEHVFLHLYEIELSEEPRLNPAFYTNSSWMTPKQYEKKSAGQPCGLCLRLWSDFAWMTGISDRPFVAKEVMHHD